MSSQTLVDETMIEPQTTAERAVGGRAAKDGEAKAFLIEIDGVDAGLAVSERGGYRFVAADRRFAGLDGRSFSRLAQLESAAEKLARRHAEAMTKSR